jgi:hypothetical protein
MWTPTPPFLLFAIAIVFAGSACRRSGIPARSDDPRFEEILVAPGEVVVEKRQVPLHINIHCNAVLVQGFGQYRDVAWAVPPFFLARAVGDEKGYGFTRLGPDRYRIALLFRVWRSPDDSPYLSPADQSTEQRRFCDLATARPALRAEGFTRTALMPIQALTAQLDIRGKPRPLHLELTPAWNKADGFTATAELTEREFKDISSDITGGIGASVTFDAATKGRRTGCTQLLELDGHDTIADRRLRDGETAAVKLRQVKLALRRSFNTVVEGSCGQEFIASPNSPADDTTMFACSRSGPRIACRFDGNFSIEDMVVTSNVIIRDRSNRTEEQRGLTDR